MSPLIATFSLKLLHICYINIAIYSYYNYFFTKKGSNDMMF